MKCCIAFAKGARYLSNSPFISFVPQNGIGDHRDAYIPNPSCKDYHIYTWLGKIIGSAFRTDETFPLAFPPFIWKLLIGDIVTWAGDYVGVDETVVRVTGMQLTYH